MGSCNHRLRPAPELNTWACEGCGTLFVMDERNVGRSIVSKGYHEGVVATLEDRLRVAEESHRLLRKEFRAAAMQCAAWRRAAERMRSHYDSALLLSMLNADPRGLGSEFSDALPDDLRALGWSVAAHNDYRLDGKPFTFWLVTKGRTAAKGEAATDAEALNQIRRLVGVT